MEKRTKKIRINIKINRRITEIKINKKEKINPYNILKI
jgi:hypothetical protein